jgi:hypothetical protein
MTLSAEDERLLERAREALDTPGMIEAIRTRLVYIDLMMSEFEAARDRERRHRDGDPDENRFNPRR